MKFSDAFTTNDLLKAMHTIKIFKMKKNNNNKSKGWQRNKNNLFHIDTFFFVIKMISFKQNFCFKYRKLFCNVVKYTIRACKQDG